MKKNQITFREQQFYIPGQHWKCPRCNGPSSNSAGSEAGTCNSCREIVRDHREVVLTGLWVMGLVCIVLFLVGCCKYLFK